jgi:hypothetical protein
MDETGDLTDARRFLDQRSNRRARGHVDVCGAHVETGIAKGSCRNIRVVIAQVGQQDMLARTHPPRNRLADRARSMTTITFFMAFLRTRS